MHYIKQFFKGKPEDWIHDLFTKYGRGEFLGPVCEVEVKKSIKFKGSVEYCNAFGRLVALSGDNLSVEGSIIGKDDFRGALSGMGFEFDDKSKPKQSYYVAQISGEYPSDVLAQIYEKIPHANTLLNIKGAGGLCKCKKNPPKPGKEKVLDFCSGEINADLMGALIDDVFFDAGKFAKARVENTFCIKELVAPAGMPASEARLLAKRKGIIKRIVVADGVEKKSETPFEI